MTGNGLSHGGTPTISEMLPTHLREELDSADMTLLSDASLLDSQQIGAEGKINVVLDKITKEPVTVRCFKNRTYSQELHVLLMCNTINEIFEGESTSDQDAVRLVLQAMILIFGRGVLDSIRADRIMDDAAIELIIDEINDEDQAACNELREDPETVACLNRLGVQNMPNPQVILLAYCGSILLLAGKQLNEASNISWTSHRVRGLSASMGTSIELTSVVPFSVIAAIRVYQKLSMLVPLRAKMVRILFGTTGTGAIVPSMAAAMLTLLSWSDMNHIKMVQDYIFGRFPELLAMKQLQGARTGVLKTAWAYLRSLDARERPFAKLLYSPQQTKALQRDKLVLITDAAHAVGAYLHVSFNNYKGDTQGTAGQGIKKIVTDYLQSLERAGLYN